jgi:hypothetical protein
MFAYAAAVLVAAPMAGSVSDLARQVEAQARSLSGQSGAAPDFAVSLSGFAEIALASSDAIRAANGPDDLACIYRGISDDARRHAAALAQSSEPAERARLLAGLRLLLGDAAAFAPMAAREARPSPPG